MFSLSHSRITTLASLLALSLSFLACQKEEDSYSAQGVFESEEIMVSAQVAGELIRFDIHEGATLQKGEVIGVIDTTQLHYQREYIKSQLATNQSAGQTDIHLQSQALDKQIEALEKEKKRIQSLVAEEIIAPKEMDHIEEQLQVVRAQRAALQSSFAQKNRSALGTSEALSIQLKQIEERIEKCHLKSPISGTVLQVYIRQGELVGEGHPIFKMADIEHIKIRCYLTAQELYTLSLGDSVNVVSDMGEEKPTIYSGKVVHISAQAEFTPKNIQSKEERSSLVYAVLIAVPNDGKLRIGQYGKILWNKKN